MMGYSIKLYFVFIILSFLKNINGQDKKLIASHVIYRHGDRTPLWTFPSDPVKEADWPNGFGQLTIRGMEQQYQLGQYLRYRYRDLLNINYTRNEIVVRSTDVDRTLMSAQSNLAGLYPVDDQSENNITIQPIPIHTVSINSDFLLGESDCSRYDQLVDEISQSDDVKRVNTLYQPFFDKIENWTNTTNLTLFTAWDIADTIFVESVYNKLPSWADGAVQANLSAINDYAFQYLFTNNDVKRIRGGPLVQDIWTNMNNSVNGSSFKKVKMYSAHDTTVSPVLTFLGINYTRQPQYASAIFIDLYQQNSNYFVRVDHLIETGSNTTESYKLDGCPDIDCPFYNFTNFYKPRFPAGVNNECARKFPPGPTPSGEDSGKMILILVILTISVIVLIVVTFFCVRERRNDERPFISDDDNA